MFEYKHSVKPIQHEKFQLLIKEHVASYLSNLCTSATGSSSQDCKQLTANSHYLVGFIKKKLLADESENLCAEYTKEEVKAAD